MPARRDPLETQNKKKKKKKKKKRKVPELNSPKGPLIGSLSLPHLTKIDYFNHMSLHFHTRTYNNECTVFTFRIRKVIVMNVKSLHFI